MKRFSSPRLHFHSLSSEMRERERKEQRQEERALVVKQERLEIKEQCFISRRVCLSSVTSNGRGQPWAQRGLSSPISPRLHLVLKHKRVSLQCLSTARPRRGLSDPTGCLLLLEPAERRPTAAFTAATTPKCGLTLIRLP